MRDREITANFLFQKHENMSGLNVFRLILLVIAKVIVSRWISFSKINILSEVNIWHSTEIVNRLKYPTLQIYLNKAYTVKGPEKKVSASPTRYTYKCSEHVVVSVVIHL